MKFIDGIKIESNNFWYDMTDGGYIKPKFVLEDLDDILAVEKALRTLIDFKNEALMQGVLEEI